MSSYRHSAQATSPGFSLLPLYDVNARADTPQHRNGSDWNATSPVMNAQLAKILNGFEKPYSDAVEYEFNISWVHL